VPEALNVAQQLYVLGQAAKGPPVTCAHAQDVPSSWQLQVVPPPVPAVPVPPPPVPAVPDVDWQSGMVSRQLIAELQSVIFTQASTALLMAAWFEQ
jgi:hypothetical protein